MSPLQKLFNVIGLLHCHNMSIKDLENLIAQLNYKKQIQMLPSVASKRILSYLPLTQLGECARVNKYWAYLVEEMRTEIAARLKINVDLEKLRENILRFENRSGRISKFEMNAPSLNSPAITVEENESDRISSKKISRTYGPKENIKKPNKTCMETVRNMAVFKGTLEKRGAANANLWKL